VLRQFDPSARARVAAAMRIRLLLATDLLSEGVNLHNAKSVVHLDVPWTAARLEQRVGRLSRIGSPHGEIQVYGFAPPNAVEAQERLVARLRAKWSAAQRRFGSSALLSQDELFHTPDADTSASSAAEALRELMQQWSRASFNAASDRPLVSCLRCRTAAPIALALVCTPEPVLVALSGGGSISAERPAVLRVAQLLTESESEVLPHAITIEQVIRRVRRYVARVRAAAALSYGTPSAARLVQRVASTMTDLPRSARPRGVQLAAAIYGALRLARSAGDLALLEEIVDSRRDAARQAPLQWLQNTHDALCAAFPGGQQLRREPVDASARVAAILLGVGS
jgi:hypothetical protein